MRETRAEVEEAPPPLSSRGGDSTAEIDRLKSPSNRSAHLVEKQTEGDDLREEL